MPPGKADPHSKTASPELPGHRKEGGHLFQEEGDPKTWDHMGRGTPPCPWEAAALDISSGIFQLLFLANCFWDKNALTMTPQCFQ